MSVKIYANGYRCEYCRDLSMRESYYNYVQVNLKGDNLYIEKDGVRVHVYGPAFVEVLVAMVKRHDELLRQHDMTHTQWMENQNEKAEGRMVY